MYICIQRKRERERERERERRALSGGKRADSGLIVGEDRVDSGLIQIAGCYLYRYAPPDCQEASMACVFHPPSRTCLPRFSGIIYICSGF
jgi:hypothetical protein